jgi:hypothetical protein
VLIQGNTDDNIKKAVDLITPLLDPYSDPERRRSQMLQIALASVLKDEFCENCGEKGHKVWECPNSLGEGSKRPQVMCEICHESSHPTYDCPSKRCIYIWSVTTKIAALGINGEMEMHEAFNKFMAELKGPNWNEDQPKMALQDSNDRFALEYTGTGIYDASVEALSKNVGTNQSLRSADAGGQPKILAIKQAEPENKMETKFKGTNSTIKIERVTLLDANGNPIGTEAPQGAVSNPIMDPVYAAMNLPYIATYNTMMLNPNAYYNAISQGNH